MFRETLAAMDISAALAKALARTGPHLSSANTTLDLRNYREIMAIAFGKASFAMAQGLTDVLAPEYRPTEFWLYLEVNRANFPDGKSSQVGTLNRTEKALRRAGRFLTGSRAVMSAR